MTSWVDPTAVIEDGVEIGHDTAVWDNVHIRRGARVGSSCILGGKTYVAPGVIIGDRVKINAFVYICTGVTIEDGVMVSAGSIFTNDRFPRATTPDLTRLRTSDPDEHTRPTLVRQGATIGAGSVIGSDLEVGRWGMVGMGSVVTRSVADFFLVVGQPAHAVGCVCRCGEAFVRFPPGAVPDLDDTACAACGLRYAVRDGAVAELDPPDGAAVPARVQALP